MEPLSSAAVVISSLIATKAFEKSGERLGEAFMNQMEAFVKLIKSKALPKTQAVETSASHASYSEAVAELEVARQADLELEQAVYKITSTVESDPILLEKIHNTAIQIEKQPSLIQNQTKLAEKIGLVVQGGEVNIDDFSF